VAADHYATAGKVAEAARERESGRHPDRERRFFFWKRDLSHLII
jgi:hypothetical protein